MRFESWRAQACAVGLCCLFASTSFAQQLVVGSGAQLSMGSSVIETGCRDIRIEGSLDLGSGALQGMRDLAVPGALLGGSGLISLSGNLAAAGTLLPQMGTVRIVDGCGSAESRLAGNHQFNRLSVQTSAAHTLVLPAGGTQFISSALDLIGGAQRLVIRSSTATVLSYLSLAPAGSQSVDRVDAIDVGAPPTGQFLAPQAPDFYNSIDRGNTPRFLGGEEYVPIPTLSPWALVSLLLLITGLALTQLRSQTRGNF